MIEALKKIVAEEKNKIRRQYKAQIKAVFGSYARSDFHADSDLDLLVDLDAGATLLDLVGLQQFLEDRLGCKVDLGTESSLREEIRASVFNEMIRL
jgi:predicted nucleotidyltransferase